MKKKIIVLLLLLFVFTGCKKEMPTENPIVTMSIEGYGDIVMELYPDIAFNTVANFVNLVEDGFYDDNDIIRVQKGFVVQAGGTKDLNFTIEGEFQANGITNNLKHTKGVISMARGQSMNSASGQFFIMLGEATYLDGQYAAFGKVIEGMDVIEEIEKANLHFLDNQYNFLERTDYIKITKATVDTKGYTYKAKRIRY